MKNKYLLALSIGILMLVVSFILNMLSSAVLPGVQAEYVNPAFRPWTDPVMSAFFLYPVVLGVLLTWVWLKTRKSWKSGLDYGLTMGVLWALPAFIVNFSTFTFSFLMILSWTVVGFVNVLVAGVALQKLE
jgi:hypothetical protein